MVIHSSTATRHCFYYEDIILCVFNRSSDHIDISVNGASSLLNDMFIVLFQGVETSFGELTYRTRQDKTYVRHAADPGRIHLDLTFSLLLSL